MDKLLNWAVFGLMGVIWGQAAMYSTNAGWTDHTGTMIVTVFTVMLVSGSTSGGSVFEHIMSGVTSCVGGLIGWAVASIVYNAVTQLIGGGFDVMMMVNAVIGTLITYVTAMLAMSAMNSIKA